MAGEVAYQGVKNRNYSDNFLSRYQSGWKEAVGFDMMVMRQARKLLNRLTDEKIDKIIRVCAKLGADKILGEVRDLDDPPDSTSSYVYCSALFPSFFAHFTNSFVFPLRPVQLRFQIGSYRNVTYIDKWIIFVDATTSIY